MIQKIEKGFGIEQNIKEIINKINEIVDWINKHEKNSPKVQPRRYGVSKHSCHSCGRQHHPDIGCNTKIGNLRH